MGQQPSPGVPLEEPVAVPAEGSDAKRFGRNFGSIALAQLVCQLLTLFASVLLARKLGVSAYGLFAFGFAFPSWFLLLISLGLDEVMATQVAANRVTAREYVTLVGLLRLLLAAIAMVALWAATQLLLADPFERTITLVLGASSVIGSYASTFTSVFRAFERLEYSAVIAIVERLFTVGVTVVLLQLGYGLYEVSLAFLGGSFVVLAFSGIITKRKFAWFAGDVKVAALARILRLAAPFAVVNTVGTFTYSAGIVLLTLLKGSDSTGLFNAAFALLLALFSFLSIVSLAALPMMSRINGESRERLASVFYRMQRLSLIFGVPLAFGGWYYAGAIIAAFYGDKFQASSEIFRILVLSFAVETAVMGIGPALAATGHAMQKMYIGTAGAAVSIALTLMLIPPFGAVGVAYAFLASRVLTAGLGALAIRRYVAPLAATGTLVKSVVASSLMLLILFPIPGLSLWTGTLVGALVYFAALWGIRGASREDRTVVWNAIRGALFR